MARLLNYTEQNAVYNAINFSDTPFGGINSTAESVGITMLWCPSDGTINGLRFFEACAGWDGTTVPITYTDYAGMLGTYCPSDGRTPNATELGLENGVYPHQPGHRHLRRRTSSNPRLRPAHRLRSPALRMARATPLPGPRFAMASMSSSAAVQAAVATGRGAAGGPTPITTTRPSLHFIHRTSPSQRLTTQPQAVMVSRTPTVATVATASPP